MNERVRLFIFIFLFSPATFCIGQIFGEVVRVSDGDSFTLLTKDKKQIRIRLHGVDCPETGQDFSNVAKNFLADLIYRKTVRVVKTDTDIYGRTIGIVTVSDTICINIQLLKAGLAWHFKRYDNNQEWAKMEDTAKQEKRGLWLKTGPIAPWDWRRLKKNK